MVTIRPSLPADIEAMRAVEVDAGAMFRGIGLDSIAEDEPPDTATLLAHIAERAAWTADHDGEIVGYAIASVVDAEGHLDQVSVHRSAAGRGIGRLLIDAVVAWAAEQELDAVTLTTFVDVPWNGPYYRRLGFVPIDEGDCGPELRAIRAAERDAGLDVSPRTAMRRRLGPRATAE